jgi:hypothetical protein
MKAHQSGKPFTPVHLVLETQEEVTAVFCLLNHRSISSSVGLNDECQEQLAKYAGDYTELFHKLNCEYLRDKAKD